MQTPSEQQQFLAAEREAESNSAALKKELRLSDLVLAQLVYILGVTWLGTAAKLGSSHVLFWLPAVLLFFIPSGLVVLHLNREMPLEGGIYQWGKLRFGRLVGFLVACNLWMAQVLVISGFISQLTANVSYAGGSAASWIRESHAATVSIGTVMILGCMIAAARGLSIGKWVHNVGGFSVLLLFVAMAAVAVPRWARGGAAIAPLALSPPSITLLNLNLLGKMAFGAFCGFDGVAIFSGECRDPQAARAIRWSVWLAAPAIAGTYIFGTAFVLVFVAPSQVDLVAPPTQALAAAAPGAGLIGAILMIVNTVGGAAFGLSAMARLPMVAGWDHLLPAWVSRLDPRYRTPTGSIVLIGAVTLVFTVLANLGTDSQEAFQLLQNSGIIFWALTYLVMFAIPLAARGEKPPWTLRVAAVSGFLMTLLFAVLSIFPIIDVPNAPLFALKVSGVIIGINAAAAWYFVIARRAYLQRTQQATGS